ncbi:hypothetical protein [Paenibacillus sp. GYB003]|uniref:hypothetical protein n=1 Tax=Paenibacillus sp. GYB003 TaxID=2994392 RepID=UPI002F9640A8
MEWPDAYPMEGKSAAVRQAQAMPSQAMPTQAMPTQAMPTQVKPTQAMRPQPGTSLFSNDCHESTGAAPRLADALLSDARRRSDRVLA